MPNVVKARNLYSVGKPKTESTLSRIELFYTPPDDPDREPLKMERKVDQPIRVGRNPGHTGLPLSVKEEDRSVSAWAVEITLDPQGVYFKYNNLHPMNYSTDSGSRGKLGDKHPIAVLREDGWIEIPGEDGRVAHRVCWKLHDFSPPPRESTDSVEAQTTGQAVFKIIAKRLYGDKPTHLMTCAAMVSSVFLTFEEKIPGEQIPSAYQIGQMKGGGQRKAVERLNMEITKVYVDLGEEPPGFEGRAGREQIKDWILENHGGALTKETIPELLPGLEANYRYH